jgi:hypothetical protein
MKPTTAGLTATKYSHDYPRPNMDAGYRKGRYYDNWKFIQQSNAGQ